MTDIAEAMARWMCRMRDECKPPPGTPDGTVCVLQWGVTGIDSRPLWVAGAYHWLHPTVHGAVAAYTPEELAAHGWRFHSIAEPPHG
jgi:hypothetical protein